MADLLHSNRILVLFAHPALEKSRVHRQLARTAQELEGVTFHDLYEAYPRLDIDVAREQELLVSHDVIVLQHPLYWYSTPAMVKEWEDLVLEHGWAYGSEGEALRGKKLLTVTSTGAREAAYCREGANRFTMRQLLAPIEQSFRLCGMEYLPPFIVHGTHALTDRDIAAHAADYRKVLEGLRDDRIDLAAADGLPRLNADLRAVLRD